MQYTLDHLGIYRPETPVHHRNDEYQESGFKTLLEMQEKHFWYIGRHQFLLSVLKRHVSHASQRCIDLGGGVGGWVRFLLDNHPSHCKDLALGDSSAVALVEARKILPQEVKLYQVDLMNLHWKNEWDIAFLLDVMEHCPQDAMILRQTYDALKPGGKLIISAPALMYFWSQNDVHANHLRRYNISDYRRLAEETGFHLVDARYFMFFLSPLYWLSRKTKSSHLTKEELEKAIQKEHQVPGWFVNAALTKIFSSERFFGHHFRFPWGTSILGIFEKPTA